MRWSSPRALCWSGGDFAVHVVTETEAQVQRKCSTHRNDADQVARQKVEHTSEALLCGTATKSEHLEHCMWLHTQVSHFMWLHVQQRHCQKGPTRKWGQWYRAELKRYSRSVGLVSLPFVSGEVVAGTEIPGGGRRGRLMPPSEWALHWGGQRWEPL